MRFPRHSAGSNTYLYPAGPEVVTIEPTDWCNFSCRVCLNRLIPSSKKGLMSPETFRTIVRQLTAETRRVNLFMGGEPLLHPMIGDFLRHLRRGPWIVKLNTNGSLLSTCRGEELLRSPPDILVISFDGESEDDYEQLRGTGRFGRTKTEIVDFLREARAARSPTRRIVQVIKQHCNQLGGPAPAAEDFEREMLAAGADEVVVEPLHDMNGRLRLPGFSFPAKPVGRSPCPKLVEELVVRWNGDVVACCCDHRSEAVVASIDETDLQSCWHSRRFVEFRRAHLELRGQDFTLCRTCDLCRGGHLSPPERRLYSEDEPERQLQETKDAKWTE